MRASLPPLGPEAKCLGCGPQHTKGIAVQSCIRVLRERVVTRRKQHKARPYDGEGEALKEDVHHSPGQATSVHRHHHNSLKAQRRLHHSTK